MINIAWSHPIRQAISTISKGVSEILAAFAEPVMRYSTIYLALATCIPLLKVPALYWAATGIVIAAPEFVIIGAFTTAEHAIANKRKWGYILMGVCFVLACIMVATFVDIFIYQFTDQAVKYLNFARCLTAVAFSVVLGKLAAEENEGEQVSAPAATVATITPQPTIDLGQITNDLEQKIRQEFATKITELEAKLEVQNTHKSAPESTAQTARATENAGTTNITILRTKRATKTATRSTTGKASKAARYIRNNPQISSVELAAKAQISESYARRLLSESALKSAVNE